MINGQNISHTIGKKKILKSVNFRVDEGAIVSLLGPSGSGKTTLLRIIMGLDSHDEGILYSGKRVLSDSSGLKVKAEKRGFSLFFQEFTLFPHLNVEQNITLGVSHLSKSERNQKVDELLSLLKITHLKNRRIDKLSGGEQQRVALARTLAVTPSLLLLDEPFSNVDQMVKQELYEKLKGYLRKYGITTLISTHDQAEAFFFSDLIYIMRDGEIVDSDTPVGLYNRPSSPWIASFLGETNYLNGSELKEHFGIESEKINSSKYYLVRPEEFECSTKNGATGTVEEIWFYGFYRELSVKLSPTLSLRIKDLHRTAIERGDSISISIAKSMNSLCATEQSRISEKERP
jgi:iron(III) transport system ATP-binding protein